MIKTLLVSTVLLFFGFLASKAYCELNSEYAADGRYAMGTILEVTIPQSAVGVTDLVFSEVERIESDLSSYREESQLSILNRSSGDPALRVSDTLAEVLALSKQLSHSTKGAFDISIGSLGLLWNRAFLRKEVPSKTAIEQVLSVVDISRLKLSGNNVSMPPGMSLDLGGIGKGYALDKVDEVLALNSVRHALISFGESSTLALGRPRKGKSWNLLVRGIGNDFLGRISLSDQALSVSRSLGKSTEINGTRFGHIFDPRTGHPVGKEMIAIVISNTATEAEAWSTALLVLNPKRGLDLIEKFPGTEALLAISSSQENEVDLRMSSGFVESSEFVQTVE